MQRRANLLIDTEFFGDENENQAQNKATSNGKTRLHDDTDNILPKELEPEQLDGRMDRKLEAANRIDLVMSEIMARKFVESWEILKSQKNYLAKNMMNNKTVKVEKFMTFLPDEYQLNPPSLRNQRSNFKESKKAFTRTNFHRSTKKSMNNSFSQKYSSVSNKILTSENQLSRAHIIDDIVEKLSNRSHHSRQEADSIIIRKLDYLEKSLERLQLHKVQQTSPKHYIRIDEESQNRDNMENMNMGMTHGEYELVLLELIELKAQIRDLRSEERRISLENQARKMAMQYVMQAKATKEQDKKRARIPSFLAKKTQEIHDMVDVKSTVISPGTESTNATKNTQSIAFGSGQGKLIQPPHRYVEPPKRYAQPPQRYAQQLEKMKIGATTVNFSNPAKSHRPLSNTVVETSRVHLLSSPSFAPGASSLHPQTTGARPAVKFNKTQVISSSQQELSSKHNPYQHHHQQQQHQAYPPSHFSISHQHLPGTSYQSQLNRDMVKQTVHKVSSVSDVGLQVQIPDTKELKIVNVNHAPDRSHLGLSKGEQKYINSNTFLDHEEDEGCCQDWCS